MTLRRVFLGAALLAALIAQPFARAAELDIKRLAPTDAYTVVHAQKNLERAYQTEYLKDAWKTFRDERIAERVYEIIESRAPADKLAKVKDAWQEMADALEPINWSALGNAEEMLMVSVMVGPVGHTVAAFRLTDEDAADFQKGVGRLFALFQKWSEDKVKSETTDSSGAKITTLVLDENNKFPFRPVVASVGDLFLISTSGELLERCLAQLNDPSAKSKFDDERLVAALKVLPKPEDTLTFFDAKTMFQEMRGLGNFIREQKKDHDDSEDAERAAKLIEKVIDEVAIIDYEVNVEYTEDGQNRVAALGAWAEGMDDTILGKALSQSAPFDNWKSWVPAEATAYSLSGGINLHELYVGVMDFVKSEIPESKETLDQWEEVQAKVGVNLDADILQAFHGECVSVTLAGGQSVTALKCSNEEKIRELLKRAIEGIKKIPQAAMYGIDLVDVDDDDLEGFQELKIAMIPASQGKPVIGFRDGWMILASSPDAAKTLLAVRAGKEKSIEGAESLKRFDMDTDGKVSAVSYTDIGAGIRAFADGIDQAAMMAPMFMGPAMAQAPDEAKKAVTEILGLLPSVAKVIRKFDFMEQNLSITRAGAEKGTYRRDSVTLIRQPVEK